MLTADATSQVLTTAAPVSHALPMYWGFLAILVTSVLLGSNLIPVKKFETGDGA